MHTLTLTPPARSILGTVRAGHSLTNALAEGVGRLAGNGDERHGPASMVARPDPTYLVRSEWQQAGHIGLTHEALGREEKRHDRR